MSEARESCLRALEAITECRVKLITPATLDGYVLPEHPLHPAYPFLSEVHRCDYLRTYFMHFHGGGYSDIKRPGGSWREAFTELRDSEAWLCGYPEIEGGIAYTPLAHTWRTAVGNSAYICKPRTPLTEAWYAGMLEVCDAKLEKLRLHPAQHARDHAEISPAYPVEWNELLGRVFHRVAADHQQRVLRTLPAPLFSGYM